MNKLVWKRNKVKGQWELKVNDLITIEIYKINYWMVYLNIDNKTIVQVGGFYSYLTDAKAKGLKIAQAIINFVAQTILEED